MIFLCDDDDFSILDVSEACKNLIGFDRKYLTTKELGGRKEKISLHDF